MIRYSKYQIFFESVKTKKGNSCSMKESFKVLSHKHANSCRHTEKQSLLLQLLKDQRLTPDMLSSWLHVMLSWRL